MKRLLVAALVAAAACIGIPAANAVCVHTHPDGSVWVHSTTCEPQPPPPEQPSEMHGGNGHGNGNGHGPGGTRRDGPGYVGGCSIDAVNDTSPEGTLGGQNVWNGEVDVAVVPTTGGTISASCWIKVNGGPESKVLDANTSGSVAIGAGRATFVATETDVVDLCARVTTNQTGTSEVCVPLTVTKVCPDQVCATGGLLDQTTPVTHSLVCPLLVALASVANSSVNSSALSIDPATGDTYVGSPGSAVLFWDCPPFAG